MNNNYMCYFCVCTLIFKNKSNICCAGEWEEKNVHKKEKGPCSLLNMMLSSPKLKMSWLGVIFLTYRYYNSARCFLLFVAVSACVVPRVLISIAIEIAVYTAYGMSRVSHAYWGYCLISLRAGILLCVKSCRLWPGLLGKPSFATLTVTHTNNEILYILVLWSPTLLKVSTQAGVAEVLVPSLACGGNQFLFECRCPLLCVLCTVSVLFVLCCSKWRWMVNSACWRFWTLLEQ